MKAALFTTFGGPEVLRLAETPAPAIRPGAVRVAVRAAGVLPFDTGLRAGKFPPTMTPGFPDKPAVPGNEFAGVVAEVGDGVTGFAPGDEVLGFSTTGGYAEEIVVPADQLAAKPASMPWDVAAALSGNGQGAYLALRQLAVGPGDTVLVHGAAGGLGTIVVQLARAWGAARVVGTASEANHDYLRSLGAVPVTYGPGLADRVRAVAPDGVDAALDTAGPDALYASVEVVADRGRILTMVADETARDLGLPEWSGVRSGALLGELAQLWVDGAFTLHIRATYPLERAADAHRDVERGHGRGKVVLTVAG
ncbi:NADP-dependent oxidoreductase [Yinghuangia seranimata]|uniref:NADP-dependent oxidoreductase n=1 Tax=Yinghuangia seranimata TaxID=408067 RepID=UPI00248B82EA|nr:NADP-dependent oxidoreductase [Yinghuangia seranimata]MDI2125939.1 NADP-dependent oxidoreductase [Yinghuangia seranimata]